MDGAVTTLPTEEYRCRDAASFNAPIERVYDVLSDLSTYDTWWTLVRTVPLGAERLAPGVRWRTEGSGRGNTTSWTVEVLELVEPERIELSYVEGDLVGRAAWELERSGTGTTAAYVYRGVRATQPHSAATFERYGTRLHSVAMQVDALANLGRYLSGEPLDEARRAEVAAEMATGVEALD
jgi:uncharacterized protein YndB with AHSA1/START domain